ncbi:MAG: NAD(P)H-binding protein [Myxococcota bacterium]
MPQPTGKGRVLLTGATGFVGTYLLPALLDAGHDVRCGSRTPPAVGPGSATWVRLDVDDERSLAPALEECEFAVYLVHSLDSGAGYEAREQRAAARFAKAAARAGCRRIVYLGGVSPRAHPSRHLRSRAATGAALRAGTVPVVELQAGIIIGPGSASWDLLRDIAVRAPWLPEVHWLRSRLSPLAIHDVTAAITHALTDPNCEGGVFDLPGPEILSARALLERTAALAGREPAWISVPLLPRRVASRVLPLVTRAQPTLTRELLAGLGADLVGSAPRYWEMHPHHKLLSLPEAIRQALERERHQQSLRVHVAEALIAALTPWARGLSG